MKPNESQLNTERRLAQEAEFAVMKEQLRVNERDHQTILAEVRHNCQANKDNFAKIEDMLVASLDQKAGKWVEKVMISFILAILTASIAMIVYVTQGHIKF